MQRACCRVCESTHHLPTQAPHCTVQCTNIPVISTHNSSTTYSARLVVKGRLQACNHLLLDREQLLNRKNKANKRVSHLTFQPTK